MTELLLGVHARTVVLVSMWFCDTLPSASSSPSPLATLFHCEHSILTSNCGGFLSTLLSFVFQPSWTCQSRRCCIPHGIVMSSVFMTSPDCILNLIALLLPHSFCPTAPNRPHRGCCSSLLTVRQTHCCWMRLELAVCSSCCAKLWCEPRFPDACAAGAEVQ